jgi:quercetin dioxygenase-like cupin family protein
MQSSKLQAAACGATLLFALAPAFAQQQHQNAMVNPGDVTWKDGPPSLPKGSQMSVLYGDPTKDGIFVMRLKFPANYKIPPHTHAVDEVVTVISGEFNLGMGPKFDAAKTKAIKAGGVIAMPPGMQHFAQVSQETVVQLSTRGPWSIAYVNPADDPRKSQ